MTGADLQPGRAGAQAAHQRDEESADGHPAEEQHSDAVGRARVGQRRGEEQQ